MTAIVTSFCLVGECGQPRKAKGYCDKHYRRWRKTGTPYRVQLTPEKRLWSKVDTSGDCWIWTGHADPAGYGRVHWDGHPSCLVHRVVYELLVGPIPDDLVLDHLCMVHPCCNPQHLEPVTRAVNNQRAGDARTYCRKGLHPWIAENILTQRQGRRGEARTCLACRRASSRRATEAATERARARRETP